MRLDRIGRDGVTRRACDFVAAVMTAADVVTRSIALAAGLGLSHQPAAAHAADPHACKEVIGVDRPAGRLAVLLTRLLAPLLHLAERLFINNRRPRVLGDDPIRLR